MPVVFAVVGGVVAIVVRPIDRVLAMVGRRDTLVGVVLENVGENVFVCAVLKIRGPVFPGFETFLLKGKAHHEHHPF